MANRIIDLTPKQQHFCRSVASGCTMSDSYRAAYNTDNMKPSTIHREATRLVSNPRITTRIEALNRDKDRALVAVTLSDKDLVLKQLRHHVLNAESEANQIRATEILGRTIPGLFKGEEATEPQRTPEEISAEIAELLASIKEMGGNYEVH